MTAQVIDLTERRRQQLVAQTFDQLRPIVAAADQDDDDVYAGVLACLDRVLTRRGLSEADVRAYMARQGNEQ